ncbi:MAG TPA: TlpA disulfide reductase family protein [Solirubrobacteraceae bacterium]|jgi:thiol-disulfide isomerase/thioredoxin
MGNRARILTALVAVIAIGALVKFGLASHKESPHGRLAPTLPREVLQGSSPQTLKTLLAQSHGGSALVVFFASWCGPCHEEAPTLERFAQTPAGRGRVLGVDWNDERSSAVSFIHQFHWSFPIVRDGEGLIGDKYRLPGLPATFVIDGHGRIRALLAGPQSEASLRRALAVRYS